MGPFNKDETPMEWPLASFVPLILIFAIMYFLLDPAPASRS